MASTFFCQAGVESWASAFRVPPDVTAREVVVDAVEGFWIVGKGREKPVEVGAKKLPQIAIKATALELMVVTGERSGSVGIVA